MTTLAILLQIVIALAIVNVWVLRYANETPWRPTGARNMREEFRHYGLPAWMAWIVGAAKLTLAALLLVGIWVRPVAPIAAAGIATLMAFAVLAHVKVRDPWFKSVPAFSLLVLSAVVVVAQRA